MADPLKTAHFYRMKPAPATVNDRRLRLIFLFAGTLFASAALMFVLQPLFGKLLLPLLGGTPAVWNTCMVFYQGVLFLGYGYAHTVSTRLRLNQQIFLHLAIMTASLLSLPVALPENPAPPTEGDPTFWLLSTLFWAIGLPFFVVSATAPLLQKWFAQVGHHTSHDPYYLYAASNTGSLLALLSYPFLLEPYLGLNSQRLAWSAGFAVLCLLLAGCALVLWQSRYLAQATQPAHGEDKAPPGWRVQGHWLLLALVPSSLLLGLTNFISTDIASMPLLWVIPLTVYLFSFVWVFSRWHRFIHPLMLRLQPLFLVPFLAFAFVNPGDLPYWVYLVLHVVAFFFAVMVCHGELAKHRPPSHHLTRYYLVMAFAGLLGGLFNTFVAPWVFNGIYEYPLMIAAALMLRPSRQVWSVRSLAWQVALPLALLLLGVILYQITENLVAYFDGLAISLMAISVLVFLLRSRPVVLGLTTGAVIALALALHGLASHTLYQGRSFFGVMAVKERFLADADGQLIKYHELFHGTTQHGAQRMDADGLRLPLTYYSQSGPIGQLFSEFDAVNANWAIGVVGLGAGAMACYAKPGQHWTFYEIDPLVLKIAEDSRYFKYLDECAQHAAIRLGDARLTLAGEPEGRFDLLVMDAFSSDAVPAHLLTQEAVALYFKKLKPGGILAFHITNRHLLLQKVLSVHAETLRLAALVQAYQPLPEIPMIVATDWVVMAKRQAVLEPLKLSRLGHWQNMPLYFDLAPWTDDFSNIVAIWK